MVMSAIAAQLEADGFVPKELAELGGHERSLFSAVRLAHGMRSNDADVCYWNWQDLRPHLRAVWSALDAEATARHGSPIQAHVWTFSRARTLEEVRSLVEAADARYSGGKLIIAVRRPDAAGMLASDKPRGALLSTLGVLRLARGISMWQLLVDVHAVVDPSATNEAVLCHLDDLAASLGATPGRSDPTEVPKLLSRYYGSQLTYDDPEKRPWSFIEFLHEVVEQAPRDPSDEQFLAWLKIQSPDPAPRPRVPHRARSAAMALPLRTAPDRIGAERSFVGIDVETANHDRASICAVAAVTVMDREVVRKQKWLCQPPPGFGSFEPRNVGIHGIHARDVAEAPPFAVVVDELRSAIGALPVVAHNAGFDVGALHRACLASSVHVPEFAYTCTMALARASLSMPSYGLAWCADQFNIPLDHHDPLSDATASALLALRLMESQQADTLDDLLEVCRLRWGRLSNHGWRSPLKLQAGNARLPPKADPNADPLHPLFGLNICITGDLVALKRAEAFARLAELGAQGKTSVAASTDMLVVGDVNPAALRPGAEMSDKAARAFQLQAAGQEIEIISGWDFLAMLD